MAAKRNFRIFAVAGGLCLMVAASGWDYFRPISFTAVSVDRARLIGKITSYQGIDELKREFEDGSWAVIEDDPGPAQGRPPFRIYVAEVQNYSNRGQSGVLRLQFFNNRLMATWFFPSSPVRFLEALKSEGIAFDDSGEVRTGEHSIIRTATDYRGRRYVAWEDARLREEMTVWMKRYS